MKKALIIASCGLILALIVGATTQSKPAVPDESTEQFHLQKCSEPVDEKPTPCALHMKEDVYVDKFLRETKRKLRRAYA